MWTVLELDLKTNMTTKDCLQGDGYGNGDGSGDGSGSGHGYGSGQGYGNGDGSGQGHGHGSGYGSGQGYGNGDGSGYGSGTKEKRKEIEKIILERIPDNELPLYLNIWEFQETRILLEKRLK